MLLINIIRLTCLELWYNRSYRVLIVLTGLTPLLGITLASLFMMDVGKVYVDVVAGVTQFIAIGYLLFLVVVLLSRDIFDKVCYLLLLPPATRLDYFFGRFLGFALMFMLLLFILLVFSILGGWGYVSQLSEAYQSGYQWYYLAQLLFFNFFQYISILGAIFFIVSWSSGDAETMLFAVSLVVFTWVFPPVLKAMQNADVSENTPDIIMLVLHWVYEAIPHLNGAEISLHLAHGTAVGLTETLLYVAEHTIYALIFFVLALIIFKRRDL